MARSFSIKDFFRRIPNKLLARYFHEKGLLTKFDFMSMKETKIEPLFNVWLILSNNQRKEIEAEFYSIHEMSCEKGTKAIMDEVTWQLNEESEEYTNFVTWISKLSNHCNGTAISTVKTIGFFRKL
ncbi:hypothetical protein L3V82_00325 [Thiotrichales bacterium 19S3-7]|nr:hypothetical protein [Thiotrichales bacterium 19S3-7]MCF6800608.1 hypothetical protein [Thiotrichales bacterium 19S3-11]